MLYMIQLIAYTALLFAVYLLILKNRTSHSWNRFYLLLCAVLPVVLPIINIPTAGTQSAVNIKTISILLSETTIYTNGRANQANAIPLNLIVVIYLIVAGTAIARNMWQYIQLSRFIKQNRCEETEGAKVLLDTDAGPGSFGRYVFFPGTDIDPVIFNHELAHIRLKHSYDLMLLRVLQALFWPNFILIAIMKELKMVHEFQADAFAADHTENYIFTLLNTTFNTRQMAWSHTFFYQPTKRRIMMLQKKPLSRGYLRLTVCKTIFTAGIIMSGIIYFQSCKQPDKTTEAAKPAKVTVFDTVNTTAITGHRQIFNYVDKMPEATYNVGEFLSTNIKYPEEARQKGIAGKVTVKFIVDEEGNIVEPAIVRSADSSLSAEALRVIKQLPQWKPGMQDGKTVPVYFTLPIVFKL